jgi:ketosteroid isomerase-like protein
MTNTPQHKPRVGKSVLLIGLAFTAVGLNAFAQNTGSRADIDSIQHLITDYAKAVDTADVKLVAQIWSNAPEVSFIHPLGHEHGLDQVEQNVFCHLMGDTFSERTLTVKDVSIHAYGDTAWAEFYWDFKAKFRKDGTPLATKGRETQIYHKEQGRWRLVHVHYSGMPVTQEGSGF